MFRSRRTWMHAAEEAKLFIKTLLGSCQVGERGSGLQPRQREGAECWWVIYNPLLALAAVRFQLEETLASQRQTSDHYNFVFEDSFSLLQTHIKSASAAQDGGPKSSLRGLETLLGWDPGCLSLWLRLWLLRLCSHVSPIPPPSGQILPHPRRPHPTCPCRTFPLCPSTFSLCVPPPPTVDLIHSMLCCAASVPSCLLCI